MTWGIWQIFTRALESLKIGILMGSFIPELKKYEFKIHRRVICDDNEEWGKIWRGLDLSFQSWHEQFDELWSEHFKVSKIIILICSFRTKYVLFELKKKYRGVIFHEPKEGYKSWRGIDLSFQNRHKEFDIFWTEHSKVSKIFTLMSSFWAKYILFELKKVQRSYLSWNWRVIQNLERNRLVVLKLTQGIWLILTWALKSLKDFYFNGLLMSKVCIV